MLGELTPALVTRVIVLNTVAGLVFGWLFWRRGLEAAMVAHATAHLPMQVLATAAA
jgi:membrane protease YdiL (CAAX protease family)